MTNDAFIFFKNNKEASKCKQILKSMKFKNRNIFALDGAYGQSIIIDMDNSKIVSVNAIHMNYNWHKIALSALK